MVIEIELFLIIGLLIVLIVRTSSLINLAKLYNATDPFFSVFDRAIIYQAKADYLIAKRKRDELLSEVSSHVEARLPPDEKLTIRFENVEGDFSIAEERFHRLLQANIAAFRGKDIASIQEEHSKWLTSRAWSDFKKHS